MRAAYALPVRFAAMLLIALVAPQATRNQIKRVSVSPLAMCLLTPVS